MPVKPIIEIVEPVDSEIYHKYYQDINIDAYNTILAIQPKKRVYKQWLLQLYRNKALLLEDLYKAEDYLMFFDRPNINSRFDKGKAYLFTLKSLPELYSAIEPYRDLKSDLEIK